MDHRILITKEANQAILDFRMPESYGFGNVFAPVMLKAEYSEGEWGAAQILPYGPLSMDPSSKVFHYGQEIFEGMKAYSSKERGHYLFRPEQNAKRFNESAKRMAMPEMPNELFLNSVECFAHSISHLIPKDLGHSLYIRPFMISCEAGLGIKAPKNFTFMIIAAPVGAYVAGDEFSVLIEREYVRAIIGGTGMAKAGGNYAASLYSMREAEEKYGLAQVLWLDAKKKCEIEELSGMNFFCVREGKIYTPKLSGSILAGITRDSIIEIAKSLSYEVREEVLNINEICKEIEAGICTEGFACGTASILMPIHSFVERSGEKVTFRDSLGKIGLNFREKMLRLQQGLDKDSFGWVKEIKKEAVSASHFKKVS